MALQGTSIARWAIENEYPLMTVYCAARYERNGPEAQQIRKEMHAFIKNGPAPEKGQPELETVTNG